MSKAYFEKEVLERAEELGDKCLEDSLCIGLLSLSSYASSARLSMLSQHLVQSLIPINPEVPGVSTGYEYMFGKYSTGYKETKSKFKVIRKIEKFPGFYYTLLVYDEKNESYDILERKEIRKLAEEYGYKWDNSVIDKYKVGSTIPKGTMYSKSPAFDDDRNFRYGVNANVVYVISQETIEDAVVVSKSFAERMATTYVETCVVPLNDNDIPLNLYGDNENYKSFPDIGESTKKSIIFGSRRKNKVMDQYNLKNNNLRKIFPGDDIFQMASNYIIGDINIWCNKPLEEMSSIPAYKQVKEYYIKLTNYNTEVYEEFGKLIDSGCKCSPEMTRLYAKAKDFLDPTCRYADEDGRIFSNIVMEFTIYKIEKLHRGCKIAGRYGNKSVISMVLPDDEMGRTENGTVPDVRMDALGVIGRLNTGQCIEQELNWIAEEVRQRIINESDISKKYKILYKFLDIASPDESEKLKEYVATLSDKERKEFITTTENNRLVIIESPIYCIDTNGLNKLYREFKPKTTKIYYKNEFGKEQPTMRDVIVGEEYIMRLKQEPITKFSVRSKSYNNPRTSMPIKSTLASKHRIVFPDQCNRLGEQENNILLISKDYAALDYFMRTYSSSNEARRSSDIFEQDPMDGYHIEPDIEGKSRAVDMLNTYFKAMGNRIVIDYDKDEQEEINTDCDIPKIPDYIKKLF